MACRQEDTYAAAAGGAAPDANQLIRSFSQDYDDYRHDESRAYGEAESISFPRSEEEVRAIVRALHDKRTPITVQGARTGLAAGAVPHGGHVLNLSHMNAYLGLRRGDAGAFFVRVQPGLVLSELRKHLKSKQIPAARFDDASRAALAELREAPQQVFPTDPTEASATLGGMAACNASGARSYRYGPVRGHIEALRLVLADGDVLALRRGEEHAHEGVLTLTTEGGRTLTVALPTYAMPHAKNASGYYIAPDVDAIDVVIGSDGTLGIITELELRLMPAPACTWGVSCFFTHEVQALDAVCALRGALADAAALEYFDGDALAILREQRAGSAAFSSLPEPPEQAGCCVYVELQCASEGEALAALDRLGELLAEAGGDENLTWVARTDVDRERLQFFRHAVPESVNMLIDERRRTDPTITKLGSDMSVPNERLHDVMELYRTTLARSGLQSAAWGHIGNNHLHVNILPRNAAEYARGKALFLQWAQAVTAMGGAVSAEHGVGKIKRDFLRVMYGDEHLREMARMKRAFDPYGQLGRGNLFDETLLEGGEGAC